MSPLSIFYLIIPVLVGFFVAEYKSDIFKLVRAQFIDEQEGTPSSTEIYETVIFVPSARGNFEKRAAIRNSWWGQVLKNRSLSEKLTLKFVVGSRSCPVHPDDRLNQYSCEVWNVSLPGEKDEIRAVEEVDSNELETELEKKNHVYGIKSLPFTVQYPVVLSKLGLYRECASVGAIVRLLEASTQREIVSATFSKASHGVLIGSFRYRPVESYYLPKGFEGVIVVDSLSGGSLDLPTTKWNRSKATKTNNSSGVINFSQDEVLPDGHYEDVRKWNSVHLHLASFIYSIHDYEILKAHIEQKMTRTVSWSLNTTLETKQLKEEMKAYGDVQMVDLTDTYRNVPQKFLKFSEWITGALRFDFLVKTDDDCFLDVVRLMSRLDELKGATNTWLGRFRNNWLVEKHGKWAEKDYPSSFYPKFACGSGYALTSDLVHWIAKNAQRLKTYQGEDVSLGIWMAAVGPRYVDEPLWQCEKDCLSNMYSMPELRLDEMLQIWTDLTSCGDPCGCN